MNTSKRPSLMIFRRIVYSAAAVIMMMRIPNLDPFPSDSLLFSGSMFVIFASSFLWQYLLEYKLNAYSPGVKIIVCYMLLFVALCALWYAHHELESFRWYPDPKHMNFGFVIRNVVFQMTAALLIGLVCFVQSLRPKHARAA